MTNAVDGVSFSFCVCYPNNTGMLWQQQGSHRLTFVWEDLTKAWITLAPSLRCHPQEKWACCKSPWQLCVLKWQTAHSQCHFIGCSFTPHCREEGSKCWWFFFFYFVIYLFIFCLWRGESKKGWMDGHRLKESPKFAGEPQSNLCPESEPQGIQLILLVRKVEALLHSLRMWTWTYKC